MDSVRLGRVLGKGARAAAKGLYEAVDAATAPNPAAGKAQQVPQSSRPAGEPLRAAAEAVAQGTAAYREQKKAVTREAGKMGKSFLSPFARAGHALFLEVMGSFFALFVVIFLSSAWKSRAAMHLNAANAASHRHFWGSIALAVLFAYFTVTSFMRAKRRERARV